MTVAVVDFIFTIGLRNRGVEKVKEYYYQIKGKADPQSRDLMSNWVWPPIFSGKVEAENKEGAKEKIFKEYGRRFPGRVLRKDIDKAEFLMKITEIKENDYIQDLFEFKHCSECQKRFRRIDLYNDKNEVYKGGEYCSDSCKEQGDIRRRGEAAELMFNENEYSPPCIYRITNKETGKCYIGQTIQSFTLRWWQHFKWGNSSSKFHEAIRRSQLTDWTFEIIAIAKSKDELDELESLHIRKNDSISNGYNTAKIGSICPYRSQQKLEIEV